MGRASFRHKKNKPVKETPKPVVKKAPRSRGGKKANDTEQD